MSVVIIYGPQGCGKTSLAQQLKAHYGCDRIIEDWYPSRQVDLQDDDLVLTNLEPPFAVPGALAIKFAVAKADLEAGQS
jgi:predicted AAA+ superfamily ATPase